MWTKPNLTIIVVLLLDVFGCGKIYERPANGVGIVPGTVLYDCEDAESSGRGRGGGAAVEVQCARAHASFNRS